MARILVIEDSIYQRTKLSRLLEMNGHQVLQASDGNEGLLTAATSEPDCILLDLVMPGMNGIEVLRALHDKHIAVPVIVHTADIQNTTRAECLRLGAAGFVNKPARDPELLEAITRALATPTSTESGQ